jgi:hypothetical protein
MPFLRGGSNPPLSGSACLPLLRDSFFFDSRSTTSTDLDFDDVTELAA